MKAFIAKYLKPYAVFGVLLLGIAIGGIAERLYKNAVISEMKLAQVAEAAKQAEATSALRIKWDIETNALRQKLADQEQIHYKDLQNAQKSSGIVIADLLLDNQRLSVRTSNKVCASGVQEAGTGSGMDDGDIRTDIHPEDAAAIIRLTSEADQCAITLTALQGRMLEITE